MKGFIFSILLCLAYSAQSQTIVAAEYFIDTDPGVGQGTSIAITAGDVVNGSFTLDVTGLPTGFHNMYIRGRNDGGRWGFLQRHVFYVAPLPTTPPTTDEKIVAAEYFIDTDPGVGNGTPISVAMGDVVNDNFTLNVTGLTTGFHNMYIRGRNNAGRWGFVQRHLFYVAPLPTPPPATDEKIVTAEYFIDTDPGVGNGTTISIAMGDVVNATFTLNVTGLTTGFHNMYIRGRNNVGRWGFVQRHLFYIAPPAPDAPDETIVAAEYFIDTDPGVGNGTPMPVTVPGNTVTGPVLIQLTQCVPPGTHRLYLRGRNAAGKWGFYDNTTITIQAVDAAITGMQHTPADPCTITAQESVSVVVKNTGANTIPAGAAQVNLAVTGANTGNFGPAANANDIPPGGEATVTVGNVNLSTPGTNTITAALALCNDAPAGNSSTIQVVGTANPVPMVNAVSNQTLCAGAATAAITFSGNTPGATYTWTNNYIAIGLAAGGTGDIPSFTALNGGGTPLVAMAAVRATFNGCTGPDQTFNVTVNPLPAASIAGNQPFCPGSSTTLTASGGGSYDWSTGANTADISVNTAGTYTVTVTNAENCTAAASATVAQLPVLALSVKVFLQGPYVSAVQLMHDSLRVKGLIPLTEPYTGLTNFTHVGGGGGEHTTPAVLAVTGNDAIVDWVFVDIRSSANPAQVLATRSALVQRDGDVVDVDGISPVSFGIAADQSYYPTVRHRNHLGVQLGQTAFYPECIAVATDFRTPPPEGYYAFNGLNPAQKLVDSKNTLWAGNGRVDFQLKYNGSNNDRTTILSVVGLNTPNAVVPGYLLSDYNLDGVVKYNGSANDRNVLLGNVGVTTPSAILHDQIGQ